MNTHDYITSIEEELEANQDFDGHIGLDVMVIPVDIAVQIVGKALQARDKEWREAVRQMKGHRGYSEETATEAGERVFYNQYWEKQRDTLIQELSDEL